MQSGRNSERATGDAETRVWDYDVFLSFRGPDTRRNFTDVLYDHMSRAGLHVFRDDDELALGDKIDEILLAIEKSILCVPIFSKTFASSKWCLKEVTRMVESQKQIVPIFYDVTTDDVKLKISSVYNKFMIEHAAKYEENVVEEWKEALKMIAGIKGREVSDTRYTEFCKRFVEEVIIKLKPRKTFEIDPVIGLENQVEHAMQLLDTQSPGVRYIGICGMGGIGKTTLAKVIFNEITGQFDSCSFIEDVRRKSSEVRGIHKLQKELLRSHNTTSQKIEECFRTKKVLIVLDDVDDWEQIEKLAGKSGWFGSRSRIIVTTRNKCVMETGYGKLSDDEVRCLEVQTLKHEHALQLFNRHAFKHGNPTDGFEELSEKVVSLNAGLPLALTVIGSFLCNKRRKVWEEAIDKLKKVPNPKVKDRLKISYDALDEDQQQIFLDIACFFLDNTTTNAVYMWEACDFYPCTGLEVLCSMSLIKVLEYGKIWMHDLLRDLGRDIVRQESKNDPTKWTRIWEDDKAEKVLMSKKDKESVEALRLDRYDAIDLMPEEIGSFESMRYLQLQRVNLRGNFRGLLPNLSWLSYRFAEKFDNTNFAIENLVILDFSYSTIDENWGGWKQLKNAKKLKVLDLSEAEHLTRTPHFSKGMALERLILNGCSKLVAIDGSICHLKYLRLLSIERCGSLTDLPPEVGDLEDLEYVVCGHNIYSHLKRFENLDGSEISLTMEITVDQHSKRDILIQHKICGLPKSFGKLGKLKFLSLADLPITELPDSFGELKSLVVLDLDKTMISNLPDSIKGFEKLKMLSLKQCKKLTELPPTLGALKSLEVLHVTDAAALLELPSSIGELAKLKLLYIQRCGHIKKLPDSLGTITSLVVLNLTASGVLELPESLGELKNLEKLILSFNGIAQLPESIGGLENLRELDLEHCPLKTLPKSFGALKKLVKLDAQYTDLSEGLPSEISGLTSLVSLLLSKSRVSWLPSSINQLHCLRTLLLIECNHLQELPCLPPNLTDLLFSSTSLLRGLHQISNLQGLSRLALLMSSPLANADRIFGIGKLSQLVELLLYLPTNMTLPDEFGNLTQLKEFTVTGQSLIIPRLPLSLEKIKVNGAHKGLHLPNLQDMKNLSFLEVKITMGISQLSLPEHLREIYIKGSPDLKASPDISHLKNLRILHLVDCPILTEIPGLGKLKSLQYLVIEGCLSLTKLENMSELKRIECIRIDSCRKLGYPEGVDRSKVIILGGDFQEMSEATTNERHNIFTLLSTPGRDDSLMQHGQQVKTDYLKGKKVWLYLQQSSWSMFAAVLAEICVIINRSSHGELAIVYVPCGSEDIWFNTQYRHWLAVPFSDGEKRERLNMLFPEHSNEAPRLCLFDESGRLETTEGFEIIGSYGFLLEKYGVGAYPFTPEGIQHLKSLSQSLRMSKQLGSIFAPAEFALTLDGNVLPVSELEGKIVGIYFSPPLYETTSFIGSLDEAYKVLKTNGVSFEILWAPFHNRQEIYYELIPKMDHTALVTWLSVSFGLYFYFNVSTFPTLVIIGKDGQTLHHNAADAIERYSAKAYPFTPQDIENARKEVEQLETSEAKKTLLFFSAHKSSLCQAFTSKLVEVYNDIKAKDDAFEVVFMSCDMDEASYQECYSTMPWGALPFGDQAIHNCCYLYKITEIPTLVAVDSAYKIIRMDVRDLIIAYGSDAYPFTNEYISNMVESWPHKLHHSLHPHELALAERRLYICDACNDPLPARAWSYYCKECNFDVHPKCAFKGGRCEFPEELGTR